MAVGIMKAWSLTAIDNGAADTNIGYAEGQSPPSLNNAARAAMAATKGFANQITGAKTTGGSANAQTYTSDSVAAISGAYAAGMAFVFKAGYTNTGACTLNVDGVGAKSIKKGGAQAALAGNDIVAGGVYFVAYEASGDCFILLNPETGIDPTLAALAALSYSSGSPLVQFTAADTVSLTNAPAVTTIELGHASDTTLSRASAGVLAVEGVNVLTTATGAQLGSGNTFTAAQTISATGQALSIGPAGTGTTSGLCYRVEMGSGSGSWGGIIWRTNGSNAAVEYYNLNSSDMRWGVGATDPALILSSAGNLTATGTVTGSSDRRFKTDILDLTEQEAVAFIQNLRPRSFCKHGAPLLGFVAQEVAACDRRFVFETADAGDGAPALSIPAGAEWAAPIVRVLQLLLKERADADI